jgi:GNAT superfamily N-acetyltransferase
VLFLILPKARGKGLGKQLLNESMSFACAHDYQNMTLWTHKSHQAAVALYVANGWVLTHEEPKKSFGVENVVQTWKIAL